MPRPSLTCQTKPPQHCWPAAWEKPRQYHCQGTQHQLGPKLGQPRALLHPSLQASKEGEVAPTATCQLRQPKHHKLSRPTTGVEGPFARAFPIPDCDVRNCTSPVSFPDDPVVPAVRVNAKVSNTDVAAALSSICSDLTNVLSRMGPVEGEKSDVSSDGISSGSSMTSFA